MTKLKDLTPDQRNANKGSARGQKMIVDSIQRNGFGRSGLLDKNGNIVAGNKTTEAAAEVFGVEIEPIVIETDGKRPVYVKRTDLDLNDPDPNNPARALAYADNRTTEVSLDWDVATIIGDLDDGMDLSGLFFDNELAEFQEQLDAVDELGQDIGSNIRQLGDRRKQIKPVLYADEVAIFEAAILATGNPNRGQALVEICRVYLEQTEGQFNF